MTTEHKITLDRANSTLHIVNGGETLLADLPPRAIALDGYVQGPEQGADDRWSFDHHAKCMRLITLATCQQVHLALSLGFSAKERSIYINDLDGDTVLSVFLLDNADLVHRHAVTELVRVVGMIDAHGPAAYPMLTGNENEVARLFFEGVLSPINVIARERGAHFDSWPTRLSECLGTLQRWLRDGQPPEVQPQPNPEIRILRKGPGIVMADSDSFGAFQVLYARDFRVVVLVTDLGDGSRRYTVGKLSDLVPYRLGPHTDERSLLGRLRSAEPGWGGGSSIGGSPRNADGSSSRLTLDQVWTYADDALLWR